MYSADEVTFSMYIAILGQSAMMHLGKVINPATGKIEKDLLQAKFTIDILGMLEEKTKGNLTRDESDLLRTTLANLRLNYVEEVEEEKKREAEKKEKKGEEKKNEEEKGEGKKVTKKKKNTKKEE